METPPPRVAVPTHLPPHEDGSRPIGPLSSSDRVEVTLRLRPRQEAPSPPGGPAAAGHYPSREEYARSHGADPADVARVEQFARDHHLTVVQSDPALRSVKLAGPAPEVARALEVSLHQYQGEGGTYRTASGPARLPDDIAPMVEAVIGLDDRPYAHRLES
jgi:kumamolisin